MTQKQDSIPAELLDQLLTNCKNPKDFLGEAASKTKCNTFSYKVLV